MAADFDVFVTDLSTLRVEALKESATGSAGEPEAFDALRAFSSQGVLGALLQSKPAGTVDVSEQVSVVGDNACSVANNDCDEAAKPSHSEFNIEAECRESIASVDGYDASRGRGKRPRIARTRAVSAVVSEGLHGDLLEEKRVRFVACLLYTSPSPRD